MLTYEQARIFDKKTPKQAAAIFRYAKQHNLKITIDCINKRNFFIIHNLSIGCGYGMLRLITNSHREYDSIRQFDGHIWCGAVSLGSKRHVSYIANTSKNVEYITLYRKQRMLSKRNPVELVFYIEKEKQQ